jgi:pimeloyl-ACP methyl ester carboxylesterase
MSRDKKVQMNHIFSQGEQLFYRESGQGKPILLLHAGIADSRMWQAQTDALGSDFILIAPDLRGFGQSPIPDGPFSHHEDVAALIAGLELEPVWLVGVSFGAQVAVDFYLAYPERVRGLVLVAPVVSGFVSSEAMAAFDEEEERLLEAGDIAGATALNMRMWVDGPFRSEEQVNVEVRSRVADMQYQAFLNPVPDKAELIRPDRPATQQLEKILAPTLIVLGALDVPAVVEHGKFLAQGIPGARLEVIPGTAHMPTMERPEAFDRLLADFVAKAGG